LRTVFNGLQVEWGEESDGNNSGWSCNGSGNQS
jgi:hypothetical protein